jgi:hypothetical protein
MLQFPPLDRWFDVRCGVYNNGAYTRHDLYLRGGLTSTEFEDLINELALVVVRLRFTPAHYRAWLAYWQNGDPIPGDLVQKFSGYLWRGFVSSAATRESGVIQFDDTAIQGYLGELLLYLIQVQLNDRRIGAAPHKPKPYSKDSGLDCLELCGSRDDYPSLHYIVWECKATTDDNPGSYPRKIYDGHLDETPKAFMEMVDRLADTYRDDEVLARFVDEMIDDFYTSPPSYRKRYGGCITLSASQPPGPNAFSEFKRKFSGILADDCECRQVRFCCVGSVSQLVEGLKSKLWSKLLP